MKLFSTHCSHLGSFMKKVLFIEPPPTLEWVASSNISKAGRRHPCLNQTGEQTYSYQNLSCASVLRQRGFDVYYLHCPTEGLDLHSAKDQMNRIKPDALVIMVEHITLPVSEKLSEEAHKAGTSIIWVGPYATALHSSEILKKYVDFILRQEWDYSVGELLETMANGSDLKKVKGLTWKSKREEVVINEKRERIEDLDSLPIPAYDLIDLSKFYESVFVAFPAATMITSRGCPNYCVFCSYPQTIYSRKFKAMSPPRVVDEIEHLVTKHGVKEIRIDDDTFNIDSGRVIDICKLLIEKKIRILF